MIWKEKFLLYPLFLCFVLFLIDKIFFLPIIVENTHSWKKIERSFYDLKEDLFSVMLEENKKFPNKNIGLILGSSRSGEFDSDHIAGLMQNTSTFNFAAPMGPPSFEYYWLERSLNANLPISYVLVEVDPLLFSKSSVEYSLNGSYDAGFILKNIDFYRPKISDPWKSEGTGFSVDETETYFLKKLFALYKYPVDPSAIKANNKELEMGFIPGVSTGITGKEHKKGFIEKIKLANRKKFGALPNEIKFANADFFLEKDAENIFNQHLRPFRISLTQIHFFKRIVKLMEGRKIPVIFYVPVVAEPLRKRMVDSGIWEDFNLKLKEIVENGKKTPGSPFYLIDPSRNPTWACKDFVDSLHLSGACFSNILPILFPEEIREKKD